MSPTDAMPPSYQKLAEDASRASIRDAISEFFKAARVSCDNALREAVHGARKD